MNVLLTDKYKNMNENLDFDQNCYSRTAVRNNKIGYDIFRLKKWLAYFDRS